MAFHERIQLRRKELNWTQEEVAEKLHVSRPTISNWETGKTFPDVESLMAISELYELSLDDIIKGDKQVQKKIKIKNDYETALTVIGMLIVLLGFWLPNGISLFAIILGTQCVVFSEDISTFLNKKLT